MSENEARQIWEEMSAILEANPNFSEIRSSLFKVKKYYDKVDPIIALYINQVILKQADANVLEWDAIRELIHGEFDSTVRFSSDFRARLHAQFKFLVAKREILKDE